MNIENLNTSLNGGIPWQYAASAASGLPEASSFNVAPSGDTIVGGGSGYAPATTTNTSNSPSDLSGLLSILGLDPSAAGGTPNASGFDISKVPILGKILGQFGNNGLSATQNAILLGLLGMGVTGNVLGQSQQSSYVSNLEDWNKYLEQMAKDPTQANTALKTLLGPLTEGLTPDQINGFTKSLLQPLSQGLTKGVGNQVQSYLASRGLSNSSGATADVLSQSLAPYQQQLLQMAGGEAMGLQGLIQNAKGMGLNELLSLLGLPGHMNIPPFMPSDLSGLLSMLMGKGGSTAGSGGGGGGTSGGSINLPSWPSGTPTVPMQPGPQAPPNPYAIPSTIDWSSIFGDSSSYYPNTPIGGNNDPFGSAGGGIGSDPSNWWSQGPGSMTGIGQSTIDYSGGGDYYSVPSDAGGGIDLSGLGGFSGLDFGYGY